MDLQSKVTNFYVVMKGRPPTFQEAKEYFEEETEEFLDAMDEYEAAMEGGDEDTIMESLLHLAKESGDLSFTHAGLCEAVGIDYDEAAELVADANMTKEPTSRGKVKKGSRYQEPDMRRSII